ncbi:putative zinc-binding metallopeptidase [Flammeovirga aprica]|uniref:Uncharacterized protein n=1 Tax=Flammeovirga aprica JL-4 TaxID=694437 RepID=A0A7X9XAR5_9BACT|nr:putative zinc-binding metallopeptidase [Flammeovirga aprica]NME69883.1 hypothetical protein [Flammeovirga aprica JL-4]
MKVSFFILCFFISYTTFGQKKVGKDIGIWTIENGKLIENQTYDNTLGTKYWVFIKNLLPETMLNKYVKRLRIYTDGEEGDLGGMTQMNESNKDWQLEIDIADLSFEETDKKKIIDYQHTLIHEFGHLLTLNNTQVEPSEDEYQDESKGYLTSEGYAKKDSYLGLFVSKFWPNEILFQWDKIDMIRNQRKRENKLFDFYLNAPDMFVTDYAAESPEEDIAESWTYFVMDDIQEKGTLREQKVSFFYAFPELVAYREEIRKKLKYIPEDYLKSFKVSYIDDKN